MNKNSDPVDNFFLKVVRVDSDTNSNFFELLELYETSRIRKLIFMLQVNIDKANSRRYNVTL